MEKGYRGMNKAHMQGTEYSPFGGYVTPEVLEVSGLLQYISPDIHDKKIHKTVIISNNFKFSTSSVFS